jgi:hypothetical protein
VLVMGLAGIGHQALIDRVSVHDEAEHGLGVLPRPRPARPGLPSRSARPSNRSEAALGSLLAASLDIMIARSSRTRVGRPARFALTLVPGTRGGHPPRGMASCNRESHSVTPWRPRARAVARGPRG